MRILKSWLFSLSRRFPFLLQWVPVRVKNSLFQRVYGRPPERKAYEKGAFPQGINLFGFLSSPLGLGQGVRLYQSALETVDMPFETLDTRPLLPGGTPAELSFSDLPYAVQLVHLNPDVLPLFFQSAPPHFWDKRYVIGVWLWELPRFPEAWRVMLPFFDEIWAPSHFIEEAAKKDTTKPVIWMPYGIEATVEQGLTRSDFGLPEKAFCVLCMFDLHSYIARKNPAASIAAFQQAFPENQEVRMVLKMHSATPEELAKIRTLVGEDERFLLLHEEMTKERVNSLIASCDTLISMHRSEGFGLVMAEAMILGVPVVATAWSANTDFMDERCACMVQYTLLPTQGAYMGAQEDQCWAEPNIQQAAAYLRHLHEDPAYRNRIATAGKKNIQSRFSVSACAERMRNRLDEIFEAQV